MPIRIFAVILAALGLCATGSTAIAMPAYSIISEDAAGEGVRVSVRLEARQTAADLKLIASDVRKRLPAAKTVRNVAFFLPATAITGQAWADVKIATEAIVTIYGLRLEEEEAYRADASADKRNRIGVWLTSPPALAGRLTLYRDGKGRTFAEWQLRSGQKTTDEVYESRSNGGRRFDIAGGDGGYYRLVGNSMLELGNARSMIAVAEPLKLAAPKPVAATPPVAAAQPVSAVADNDQSSADASSKPEAAQQKPSRKRTVSVRPRAHDRPSRQADATGDAISRALAQ